MASMTPDFLSKIFFWRKLRSRDLERENISNEFNKWEDCVNKIQKILIWDDPVISSLSLVAVNLLFWLLIHFECKFYGLVFTALLTFTLHQLWVEHIRPELKMADSRSGINVASNPEYSSSTRLLTMAEISRYAARAQEATKNACLKVRRLRQDQPGSFCVIMCVCFLLLSVIGRSISGVALLYTLLMIIMIVPGVCIHLLPSSVVSSFTSMFNSSHKDNDNEVEEYLPETNGETLELLNLVGELQLTPREDDEDSNDILLEQMSARTNDTAESSCSKLSFCPDASMMPSHENSLDFFDFDMPSKPSDNKKSDSNDSEFSDIQFQTKHFNGDSSDEDEEEFSKGLEFKQIDKSKRPKEEVKTEPVSAPSFMSAANVGRNIISLGANILTHVVKQQTELKRNDRESSSDTDSFELISEEDM